MKQLVDNFNFSGNLEQPIQSQLIRKSKMESIVIAHNRINGLKNGLFIDLGCPSYFTTA